MDSLDLVGDLENNLQEDNVFEINYKSDRYKRFNNLLKKYCVESKNQNIHLNMTTMLMI